MPKPDKCPDPLYSIMLECWNRDPEERPTFESLKYRIEDYYVSAAEGSYQQNVQ